MLKMILKTILRCDNNGLRPLNAISLARVSEVSSVRNSEISSRFICKSLDIKVNAFAYIFALLFRCIAFLPLLILMPSSEINAREPVDECIRFVSIRKLGVCHSESPDSAIHIAFDVPFHRIKKSCLGTVKTDSMGSWLVNNAGETFGNALRDAFYDSVCVNQRQLMSQGIDSRIATISIIDCVDFVILQKNIHLDNDFYPGLKLINRCFEDKRNQQ